MSAHEPPAEETSCPVALVTGGSAGLGRALAIDLAGRGWLVVADGRDPGRLRHVADAGVRTVGGDLADPAHRDDLVAAARDLGRLDLLVHNASTLGPLPLRSLRETDEAGLLEAWRSNVLAAHALTRSLAHLLLAADGALVSISSDAAIEHYPTWGTYGATKAALDHLTLTWGVEEGLAAYAVDPGEMRTRMHQDAFPGEDISDRPDPASVVPRLLALLDQRPPSGRYVLAEALADAAPLASTEEALR